MVLTLAVTPPMVQKSKWLESVSAEQPVSDAARRAVRARLELVERYVSEAAHEKHPDSDLVHQLRVSTRRAAATMDSFDELLPARRARWIRKRLKRVRKAANDARDYDVLVERLSRQELQEGRGSLDRLVEHLKALRRQAQEPLAQLCAELEAKNLARRVKRLTRRIDWSNDNAEATFGTWAIEKVRAVADPFFESAKGELSDVEHLHQFRIRGKSLRYAMEIFVAAFPPHFREELYPLLATVQDKLGEINDHATAIERFERWITEWSDPDLCRPLGALLDAERRALSQCRAQFQAWWTPERASDWQRRFDEVLSNSSVERVA